MHQSLSLFHGTKQPALANSANPKEGKESQTEAFQ